AIAFFIWNYVLTNMEAGKASVAMMAVPAVGVLSGILILGEPMTLSRGLGMAAIIVGILTVLTGKEQRRE
ncbi:MAG: EamA family transporter, partial [Firmicutes bacterium]|nr:EamA family transporter [Bacillota bacterium]